jgi:hypothetical protein
MNYAPSPTELSDYRLLLALMKRFTSSNKLTGCQPTALRLSFAPMRRTVQIKPTPRAFRAASGLRWTAVTIDNGDDAKDACAASASLVS